MEPLLARINKRDLQTLIDLGTYQTVKRRSYVYKEGAPADELYFIEQGEIRVFKNMGEGKELTIFVRSEEDGFGEIGIFSGENYSNSAQALKDSKVFSIKKSDIEHLIEENGALGLEFTRWVAQSLEASKAKMRDYLAFGSEGAVASVFVRYSNMYGIVTVDGIQIKKPIMIQDISKHIGTSRETVSRIVNKWKEQGILWNDNKYFVIKDIEYFKKLLVCDECGVEHCVL